MVDLATGRQLSARDILLPDVLTENGIDRLTARLAFTEPHEPACQYSRQSADILFNLLPQAGHGTAAGLFLSRTGIASSTFADHECTPGSGDARCPAVRGLINPAVLPLLPAG